MVREEKIDFERFSKIWTTIPPLLEITFFGKVIGMHPTYHIRNKRNIFIIKDTLSIVEPNDFQGH